MEHSIKNNLLLVIFQLYIDSQFKLFAGRNMSPPHMYVLKSKPVWPLAALHPLLPHLFSALLMERRARGGLLQHRPARPGPAMHQTGSPC